MNAGMLAARGKALLMMPYTLYPIPYTLHPALLSARASAGRGCEGGHAGGAGRGAADDAYYLYSVPYTLHC